MITDKQRQERVSYLGSSDAAAVMGHSRWSSPLKVWTEKTGMIPPDDISQKLNVRVGNKMENTVAELFMEDTGKKLHRVKQTLYHPKYPFLACNLDRRIVGEDAIVEIKTASVYKSKEWEGDEIPYEYIFQVFHQLLVSGMSKGFLAVLIGNSDFKIKEIPRDEILLTKMTDRLVDFWNNYVIPKVMPSTVMEQDGSTLDKLYPQGVDQKEIVLGDEANQYVEQLQALEADKRNLEGLIDEHKNKLKLMLGDAVIGTTSLNQIRWVNSKWSGLNTELLNLELPEVYNKYFMSRTTRRFSYGKIKGEK